MLMLLFHVGDQAYAINCQYIFEVVPYIHLKKIPSGLNYVNGLANFEGHPVSVVDFSQLIANRPSAFYLHTRIIFLVEDRESHNSCSLGMIAEKVIEVRELSAGDFFEPELNDSRLPFLDGIAHNSGHSIQRVDVDKLFQFLQAQFYDKRS